MIKTKIILLFLLYGFNLNSQSTYLWKITNNQSESVSYIFGTNHQIGGSFLESYPVVLENLEKSDLAIFESVDGNREKTDILKKPDSYKYRKALGKDYANKLDILSSDWSIPVSKLTPPQVLFILGKNFTTHKCEAYLPQDSIIQLDDYLQNKAESKEISIYGLETDSLQGVLITQQFKGISWKSLKKNKNFKKRVQFWIDANNGEKDNVRLCKSTNDYKQLKFDFAFEKECPNDVMLKQRNKDWMYQLPKLLMEKNCFIVVGIAHLAYDCGLIEQLKENGFHVEPVVMKY